MVRIKHREAAGKFLIWLKDERIQIGMLVAVIAGSAFVSGWALSSNMSRARPQIQGQIQGEVRQTPRGEPAQAERQMGLPRTQPLPQPLQEPANATMRIDASFEKVASARRNAATTPNTPATTPIRGAEAADRPDVVQHEIVQHEIVQHKAANAERFVFERRMQGSSQAPSVKNKGRYELRAGTFVFPSRAEQLAARLRKLDVEPSLRHEISDVKVVLLSIKAADEEQARALLPEVRQVVPDAFVVAEKGGAAIQVGTFYHYDNAKRLISRLQRKGYNVTAELGSRRIQVTVVAAGAFADRDSAERQRKRLTKSGIPVVIEERRK